MVEKGGGLQSSLFVPMLYGKGLSYIYLFCPVVLLTPSRPGFNTLHCKVPLAGSGLTLCASSLVSFCGEGSLLCYFVENYSNTCVTSMQAQNEKIFAPV